MRGTSVKTSSRRLALGSSLRWARRDGADHVRRAAQEVGMFGHTPIETVADAQRRAKQKLPKAVYTAILAGNEKGVTCRGNVEAFNEIGFLPRVGDDIAPSRDMATSILGERIDLPVV